MRRHRVSRVRKPLAGRTCRMLLLVWVEGSRTMDTRRLVVLSTAPLARRLSPTAEPYLQGVAPQVKKFTPAALSVVPTP